MASAYSGNTITVNEFENLLSTDRSDNRQSFVVSAPTYVDMSNSSCQLPTVLSMLGLTLTIVRLSRGARFFGLLCWLLLLFLLGVLRLVGLGPAQKLGAKQNQPEEDDYDYDSQRCTHQTSNR